MKIIGWMLTRMILVRFIFILLGISIFVITLDIVTYPRRSWRCAATAVGDHLRICLAARRPACCRPSCRSACCSLCFSSLTELSYRNEMPAIWSAGVSPVRLMVMLLPFALLAGGLHFLLNDQAVPRPRPTCANGASAITARRSSRSAASGDPIWMRAGTRHPARRQRQCGGHRARATSSFSAATMRASCASRSLPSTPSLNRGPLACCRTSSSIIARTCRPTGSTSWSIPAPSGPPRPARAPAIPKK